jgi:Tetracyclin repressor-like, C-terminal domain
MSTRSTPSSPPSASATTGPSPTAARSSPPSLLEAARRPALQLIAQRWTEAYMLTLSRLLERAGSASPRADAELLIGATDGLLLEQLASGKSENLNPRLRRLAAALVAAR